MNNTMVKRAKYLSQKMKGYDELILNVVPVWVDEELTGFDISFSGYVYSEKEDEYFDYTNIKNFRNTHTDVNGLIDLLIELRGLHIDKFTVSIYSYYHGCDKLLEFYRYLIDNLDCYDEFHMESEWG